MTHGAVGKNLIKCETKVKNQGKIKVTAQNEKPQERDRIHYSLYLELSDVLQVILLLSDDCQQRTKPGYTAIWQRARC